MDNRNRHHQLLEAVLRPEGNHVAVVGGELRKIIAQLGYLEEWQWCHEEHRSEAEAIDALLDIVGGENAVTQLDEELVR